MRLLLDTHIWLWSLLEPARLTSRVSRALTNDLRRNPGDTTYWVEATQRQLRKSTDSRWKVRMATESAMAAYRQEVAKIRPMSFQL